MRMSQWIGGRLVVGMPCEESRDGCCMGALCNCLCHRRKDLNISVRAAASRLAAQCAEDSSARDALTKLAFRTTPRQPPGGRARSASVASVISPNVTAQLNATISSPGQTSKSWAGSPKAAAPTKMPSRRLASPPTSPSLLQSTGRRFSLSCFPMEPPFSATQGENSTRSLSAHRGRRSAQKHQARSQLQHSRSASELGKKEEPQTRLRTVASAVALMSRLSLALAGSPELPAGKHHHGPGLGPLRPLQRRRHVAHQVMCPRQSEIDQERRAWSIAAQFTNRTSISCRHSRSLSWLFMTARSCRSDVKLSPTGQVSV